MCGGCIHFNQIITEIENDNENEIKQNEERRTDSLKCIAFLSQHRKR
jgi:hypothetical protein